MVYKIQTTQINVLKYVGLQILLTSLTYSGILLFYDSTVLVGLDLNAEAAWSELGVDIARFFYMLVVSQFTSSL